MLALPAFQAHTYKALRTIAFDKDGFSTTGASKLVACAVIDSDYRLGRALNQDQPCSVFHFTRSYPASTLSCCLNTRICCTFASIIELSRYQDDPCRSTFFGI